MATSERAFERANDLANALLAPLRTTKWFWVSIAAIAAAAVLVGSVSDNQEDALTVASLGLWVALYRLWWEIAAWLSLLIFGGLLVAAVFTWPLPIAVTAIILLALYGLLRFVKWAWTD